MNVYDTILLLQRRQDWLRDYLLENEFDPLPFAGSFSVSDDIREIVSDIRKVLGLDEDWASRFRTWEDSLKHLTERIEDKGIITVFNGVVENNTSRPIKANECRGFVLADQIAPFMFINNSDGKAAQMFTIAHELAHIWTGQSAGFDFRRLQPANDPIEERCDKVAAEFLVSESAFNKQWEKNPDIKAASSFFKVSEIVIARRALDTHNMNKNQFFTFYKNYSSRQKSKKLSGSSGGDYYATTKKRLSVTYASHIDNAVRSGELLYRDAYKLTSLKGDTFHTFFSEHM